MFLFCILLNFSVSNELFVCLNVCFIVFLFLWSALRYFLKALYKIKFIVIILLNMFKYIHHCHLKENGYLPSLLNYICVCLLMAIIPIKYIKWKHNGVLQIPPSTGSCVNKICPMNSQILWDHVSSSLLIGRPRIHVWNVDFVRWPGGVVFFVLVGCLLY